MRYVAHEAEMISRDGDGAIRRDLLEASAARGNPAAVKALESPEYDPAVEYLLGWAYELVGRSGSDMNGAAPLSWATLDAWSSKTGRNPTAQECQALMELDHAIRNAGKPKPEAVH